MPKQKVQAPVCGKEAMLEQLKMDGHAPSDFTFYFVTGMSPHEELEVCNLEELPDNLDSFCCQAQDGWPLYNYDQRKDPKIVKIENPESNDDEDS